MFSWDFWALDWCNIMSKLRCRAVYLCARFIGVLELRCWRIQPLNWYAFVQFVYRRHIQRCEFNKLYELRARYVHQRRWEPGMPIL
jgi:hypothetical protein